MTENGPRSQSERKRGLTLAVVGLLLLTFFLFGDVLLSSDKVISNGKQDLVTMGIPWRAFGFGELQNGNLPLWNPHVFLGEPFLAGFQSALFYPPNLLYLILPVGVATNWLIAGHVFLSGLFMCLWAARRGLHPAACFMAGAMLMLCGPQFAKVYAGQLPNILAMAWLPLLFLTIDAFIDTRRNGWLLLGAGALTVEILAGHPQYVFYTAIAAGIYTCCSLIQQQNRLQILLGLSAMLFGGCALAAVQLLPGLAAANESIRGAKLPFVVASSYAVPPENLLTLVAPGFFGDDAHVEYWGRWNRWETTLTIGATGLILALYGAIYGNSNLRRFSAPMAIILLIFALGKYTPLFQFLYDSVPNFDKLRAVSRFTYLAALFVSMLAAVGLDRLIHQPVAERRWGAGVGAGAILFGLMGAALFVQTAGPEPAAWWRNLVARVGSSQEMSISPAAYADPASIARFGQFAALSLALAAVVLALLAALLMVLRTTRLAAFGIAGLAVLELFAYAWSTRDTFQLSTAYAAEVDEFLEQHPGDYRVLNLTNHNRAMMRGAYELWGNDSLSPLRLSELLAATQPQEAMDPLFYAHYPKFRASHPLYQLLRVQYIFQRTPTGVRTYELPAGLPRLQLIPNYRVMTSRDAILAAINVPSFDPRNSVILETAPGIKPTAAGASGVATVMGESSDHLDIEAHLPAPAILLITDGWSKNWQATALPGSVQQKYDIQPADYVLRAIPLSAGDHRIHLEYRSLPFEIGKWISLVSLVGYCLATGAYLRVGSALVDRLRARGTRMLAGKAPLL